MMSHTLLIAERELRERRFVFAAAAVGALMPYIAFLLPGTQNFSRQDAGTVGIVIAIIFAVALSFIVGASLVGRELSERRLSFYFTRPLPGTSIWFGKLLAGVLLVVASFAIIAVPAVIASSPRLKTFAETPWWLPLSLLGWFLAMLLIGHTISTMVRSRSPRIAIDLALLVVAITAGWFIVRRLFAVFADEAASWTLLIFAIGLVISAVAAGAWQLSRGRSEARRSHAALSQFLWPSIGVVLLIGAGFVAWIFSARPSDLIDPDVAQPAPQWLYMMGKAHLRSDYHPVFVVNAANGDSVRLQAIPAQGAVSRDGQTLGFVGPTSFNKRGPFELKIIRLGSSDRRVIETGIEVGAFDARILSDDGRLYAHIRNGVVSVHDLEANRLVASARLPNPTGRAQWYKMAFTAPGVLRIYELPRSASPKVEPLFVHAFELDLAKRALTATGEMRAEARGLFVTANDNASRLIVQQWGERNTGQASIVDARTLRPIAGLNAAVRPFRSILFLSDSRIAAMEGLNNEACRLVILSPDGQRLSATDIPTSGGVFLVGEAPSGKLVLYTTTRVNKERSFDYTALVLDTRSGAVERREPHVGPVWPGEGPWGIDPRQPRFDNQRVWTLRDQTAVWRWNPATGEKTLLVRARTDS